MTVPLPAGTTRWRRSRCGDLTRFGVTRSFRDVGYVRLDSAGDPEAEEREVLGETIGSVRRRRRDVVDRVELVDRPAAGS